MTPSLAARHVRSVSPCCWSARSKSGSRGWNCPRRETGARTSVMRTAIKGYDPLLTRALMPSILHRPGGVQGSRVRACQPLTEEARGFRRRGAIERHQRRGHARQSDDVRAPAVLRDRRNFDQIDASGDAFFESMDGAGHCLRIEFDGFGSGLIVCAWRRRSSEAPDESACTRAIGEVPERPTSKKIFDGDPSTGNAPIIHSFSTRGLVYI